MNKNANIVNHFAQFLNEFAKNHPRQLVIATVAMAVFATLIILSQNDSAGILYEGF